MVTPLRFAQFERHCVHVDAAELTARRSQLEKRRGQLVLLAQKHRFQIRLATSIADALIAALVDVESYAASELPLLNGAIGYFLDLEDDAHDLKDPNGFDGDAQVSRSVLEVLGRGELAAEIGSAAVPA
jgi:hypothetical protein